MRPFLINSIDAKGALNYVYFLGYVHDPVPVTAQDNLGLLEKLLIGYELVVGSPIVPHAAAAAAPRSPLAGAAAATAPRSPLAGAAAATAPRSPLAGAAAATAPRSPLAGAAAATAPRSPLAGSAAELSHNVTADLAAFRTFVNHNEYREQIINPTSRVFREKIRGFYRENIVFGTPDDPNAPPTIEPSALPVEANYVEAIRNAIPQAMLTMSDAIFKYKKQVGQKHLNNNNQLFFIVEAWKCRVIEKTYSVIYERKQVHLMLPPCFPVRIVSVLQGVLKDTSIRFTNLAHWVFVSSQHSLSLENSDNLFPNALCDLLLLSNGAEFSSIITQTIEEATGEEELYPKLGILDWLEDEEHKEEKKHVALIPYNVIALGWGNEFIPCDTRENTVADAFRNLE